MIAARPDGRSLCAGAHVPGGGDVGEAYEELRRLFDPDEPC
jgi:hypothetical protein